MIFPDRTPIASEHFDHLLSLIRKQEPFVFVRFSDGEMEIIRNERLVIGETSLTWRKGTATHNYPVYDQKNFDPLTHDALRQDLLASARQLTAQYVKGIPATHNRAVADRDLMISLNAGSLQNLSFADLFLNGNYLRFVREVVPLLRNFPSVVVLGNFRMKPRNVDARWVLEPIPDNFFENYDDVRNASLESLLAAPTNSLILSSASSLSNVVGAALCRERQDLTFIDIGTSLHGLMGLDGWTRQYHAAIQPWTWTSAPKKIRNRMSRGYNLTW